MKNNEKVTIATKVGEGADAVIPDDIKPLEFIQKVFKLLREWSGQEKKRGFLLIATCECCGKDSDGGLALGYNGDDDVLAKMMGGALDDKGLQDMLIGAFKSKVKINH